MAPLSNDCSISQNTKSPATKRREASCSRAGLATCKHCCFCDVYMTKYGEGGGSNLLIISVLYCLFNTFMSLVPFG